MTYREIAETFQDLYGISCKPCWIAHMKALLGLISDREARALRSSFSGTYERLTTPQGHPNKRMGDRRCRLRAADRQLVIYKSGLWSRFGRSAHPPKNNPPQHSFFTARR